ncbi:MAG: glycosyltransferase [Rubritepida sp.]|nr:glycosyltransferase [Rubritepida sp.]
MPADPSAPLRVLVMHEGATWLRGTEFVLLDILRHLDREAFAPLVWCSGEVMEEAVRALGYPVHRSPFAAYLNYPGSWAHFRTRYLASQVLEARRLIHAHGAQVLHGNSSGLAQTLAPAAALTGRPLMIHVHNHHPRRARFVFLVHQADLLAGVADALVRPHAADGMPPERLRTIRNGIDPARLAWSGPRWRDRLGIPAEAPLVGTLGSLIHRKGHDVLVEALRRLGGPAHAMIGGSGPDEAAIRAAVAAAGLEGRVHFAGQVDDPGAFYAGCDVFALASREEGMPLVLAEAGYAGVPAVASDVGGVAELVRDGETGRVVPPEDPAALAEALGALLADAPARARMGEAAAARVRAELMLAGWVRLVEASWRQLAAQGRGSSLGPSRLRCYARLIRGTAGPD